MVVTLLSYKLSEKEASISQLLLNLWLSFIPYPEGKPFFDEGNKSLENFNILLFFDLKVPLGYAVFNTCLFVFLKSFVYKLLYNIQL